MGINASPREGGKGAFSKGRLGPKDPLPYEEGKGDEARSPLFCPEKKYGKKVGR